MTAAPPTAPATGSLDAFREDRTYLGADHSRNERRTRIVAAICIVTLVVQVGGGLLFRSMALTASGLHMAAHVAALLAAAAGYALARKHADNPAFSFGTGKVGYLAGFANAVILVMTALLVAVESLHRLIAPEPVGYDNALPIAIGGLVVNVICIWLLRPTRTQAGRHDPNGDLNISAAHLHLSADAAVSVLVIAAVVTGARLGWGFMDPLAGLVGAALMAQFSAGLIRRAGASLLDMNPSAELTAEVRSRLAGDGDEVIDLHLWRLGPGHHAVIAVVAAAHPQPAEVYRARLLGLTGLSHVTVEVRSGNDHGHDHGHSHD